MRAQAREPSPLELVKPGALIEGIWERDATDLDRARRGALARLARRAAAHRRSSSARFAASPSRSTTRSTTSSSAGWAARRSLPRCCGAASSVDWFHVLDTTHPKAIRALEEKLDLERTLFVSSSKSGTTLETRSHIDYFWEKTGKRGAHVRRRHRSRLGARAARPRARVPRRLRRRAVDRRPLLGALPVRDRPGGVDGRRRARACSSGRRRCGTRAAPTRATPATSSGAASARAGRRAATRSASPTRPATSGSGPSS